MHVPSFAACQSLLSFVCLSCGPDQKFLVTESVGLKIQDLGLTSLSHEFARQTADVDEQHFASCLIQTFGELPLPFASLQARDDFTTRAP
jgi:hypothetical protein